MDLAHCSTNCSNSPCSADTWEKNFYKETSQTAGRCETWPCSLNRFSNSNTCNMLAYCPPRTWIKTSAISSTSASDFFARVELMNTRIHKNTLPADVYPSSPFTNPKGSSSLLSSSVPWKHHRANNIPTWMKRSKINISRAHPMSRWNTPNIMISADCFTRPSLALKISWFSQRTNTKDMAHRLQNILRSTSISYPDGMTLPSVLKNYPSHASKTLSSSRSIPLLLTSPYMK